MFSWWILDSCSKVYIFTMTATKKKTHTKNNNKPAKLLSFHPDTDDSCGIPENKPWTNERTVYSRVTCINKCDLFRNFAAWKWPAPRIKSNILIIWISVSEQSNHWLLFHSWETTGQETRHSWLGIFSTFWLRRVFGKRFAAKNQRNCARCDILK